MFVVYKPCSLWYVHHVCVLCLVAQSCPALCDPMDRRPPGSSVHGDSPGKNTGVGCHALLQGNLPNPGIKPRFPTLQVDSLLSESPGKPMNTGVDSLSFLQGIFLILESNQVSCIAGPKRVRQIVIVNIHVRNMLQTGSWEAWKPKQKEDVDKYISLIFRKDVC